MSNPSLKLFIDLVTFDQNLSLIQQKINTIIKNIDQLNHQRENFQKSIALWDQKHLDLSNLVQEYQKNIADAVSQEQRMTAHLDQASNSKEYDAGIKELEHFRLQRVGLETKMVQMLNRIDSLTKEKQAQTQEISVKIDELQRSIADLEQAKQSLQAELSTLEQQRADKILTISPDWLDNYELMKNRVHDPVVPLEHESCSACFYGVTPRDLQRIKTHGIIECKDCYRFLYEKSDTHE